MLNKMEQTDLLELQGKYYMPPIVEALDRSIIERGVQESFSYLYSLITESKPLVLAIIHQRALNGIITDEKQASKTVVGAIFSNAIIYLFLKAKEQQLVRADIFITAKASRFKDLVAITVGDETQKPDLDLVIYSSNDQGNSSLELIILSLKTSLRERAGQTYKWKLLLEIATTANPIKENTTLATITPKCLRSVLLLSIFIMKLITHNIGGCFNFLTIRLLVNRLMPTLLVICRNLLIFATQTYKLKQKKV